MNVHDVEMSFTVRAGWTSTRSIHGAVGAAVTIIHVGGLAVKNRPVSENLQ